MDSVRRIVSGKKARFTNGELDLDLVQLTDRVILMGYPASGVASLYRNQRKDVHTFLRQYAPENKYRIVNLCPRYENQYDADEFEGRVLRHPFPDHYPPCLSLIPIFVHRANTWMNQDPENLLIIHCKAGKGRSGTFGICYLLAQPGLPSAPHVDPDLSDGIEPSVPAIDPSPVAGSSTEPSSKANKVAYLLDFHTKRRMAPGTTSRGVSIASQRRWIGYWARILDDRDPRPKPSTPLKPDISHMRQIKIEWIKLWGGGLTGVAKKLGGDRIAVQVFRYRDSIARSLRERELAIASGRPYDYDDQDWDDRSDDMIVKIGGFSEGGADDDPSPSSSGNSTPDRVIEDKSTYRLLKPRTTYLQPSYSDAKALDKDAALRQARQDGGLVLDGDREVQLKLLLGKSGRKHGALPAMAALGVLWFIPSFESSAEQGKECVLRIEAGEVDFLKPQANIDAVEIGLRWL